MGTVPLCVLYLTLLINKIKIYMYIETYSCMNAICAEKISPK